jgi:hypothetical protein
MSSEEMRDCWFQFGFWIALLMVSNIAVAF